MFNQKAAKAGFKDPTTTTHDKVAVERGRELCKNCASILPAKWRVKAGYGPFSKKQMLIRDSGTAATYQAYLQ